MGVKGLSRTMTPAHYEESWESVARTILLLRAWALWRADVDGWAAAKEYRIREQVRQRGRLLQDLKAYHGGVVVDPFLLGCKKAYKTLRELVPALAAEFDGLRGTAGPA